MIRFSLLFLFCFTLQAQAKKGYPQTVLEFGAKGNGSDDDFASIQAAVTASTNIHFPNGTYRLTAPVVLHSGLKITADSKAILQPEYTGSLALWGSNVNNVDIRDIRIVGTGAATAPADTRYGAITIFNYLNPTGPVNISGVVVSNCYNGISVLHSDNVTITRCTVDTFSLYAVLASMCSYFKITDNYLANSIVTANANSYGISASGASSDAYLQTDGLIQGNTIKNIPAWDGIMSHAANGLRIIGNDIRNVRNGLDIGANGVGNYLRDVQIIGNYIEATSTDTWTPANATHYGIFVKGDPSYGLTNSVVQGNVIKKFNSFAGVYAPAGNYNGSIVLEDCDTATVSGNIIAETGTSFSSFVGIGGFRNKSNIRIYENIICDVPGYGIRLGYSDNVLGWSVHDNTFGGDNTYSVLMESGSGRGHLYGNHTSGTAVLALAGFTFTNQLPFSADYNSAGDASISGKITIGGATSVGSKSLEVYSTNGTRAPLRVVLQETGGANAMTNGAAQFVTADTYGSAADFGHWSSGGAGFLWRGYAQADRDQSGDVHLKYMGGGIYNENPNLVGYMLNDGTIYSTNTVGAYKGFVVSTTNNFVSFNATNSYAPIGMGVKGFVKITVNGANFWMPVYQ